MLQGSGHLLVLHPFQGLLLWLGMTDEDTPWCSPSGCKVSGLTFLTAEVMVHTFNCWGLFIFTNNSSKLWVWDGEAVVSDKGSDIVPEAIRDRSLHGQQ